MAGNGKPGWLPVIEDGHTLDLAHLRRKGLLVVDGVQRTATIQWHVGVSRAPTLEVAMTCFATPEYGWLELRYKLPKSDGSSIDMHERIHLLPRPQPYGGYRIFAKCPFSGRACRCLYLLNGAARFQSRHGYSVRPQHRTQGLAKHQRLLEQRSAVGNKLLRKFPSAARLAMDGSDVPPRPKGMHVKTYERLAARWRLYDQMANATFDRWFERC